MSTLEESDDSYIEIIERAKPIELKKRRSYKKRRSLVPEFSIDLILKWADDHYENTGNWPTYKSGLIRAAPGESWQKVQIALRTGLRGLPGGSSLARLLFEHRNIRNRWSKPRLTEQKILEWADSYYAVNGVWPTADSGSLNPEADETWHGIESALRTGVRGLPGKSSLAQLLADRRSKRNPSMLPTLSEEMILQWADAHKQRTGSWPTEGSGPIWEAPGETWSGIRGAIYSGCRGLPGGNTLTNLLATHRGVRNAQCPPALTIETILIWADKYYERHGKWPGQTSGEIEDSDGESWRKVHAALRLGLRGLPGGSSLARLLAEYRDARNKKALPPYTEEQILAWADANNAQTGKWPTANTGPIAQVRGETWSAVEYALREGLRGLPGGSSLARLLAEQRGVRNKKALPPYTEEQILVWADAYYEQAGKWPTRNSGMIPEAPGETWKRVETALYDGVRGLPGGSSLYRLIAKHRRV